MRDGIQIVGLVSSPHREGMTAPLVASALEGAREAGAETRTVFLAEQPLDTCHGCDGTCWETLACARDPDGTAWHASLQRAAGLVMAVPVYCWQMNGLASLFIDRMRWDTGSVLEPRNRRTALGISCAGGSGTGCVLGLQALYRYFCNWAFHGLPGIPVTRFNYREALAQARQGGAALARAVSAGVEPFQDLGEAMAHYERLPYMAHQPLDELEFIVEQLTRGLAGETGALLDELLARAAKAKEALTRGDRRSAASHLAAAYRAGSRAWADR